jgi:hypothetical protein
VIDGLQRISTLIHFAGDDDLLATIDKPEHLRLVGLHERKLTAFNGKALSDLPMPIQLTFFKRALRVTALSDKSDMEVRFDMFERLNTGGIALTPQEIRACVYRGDFAELLGRLASYEPFVKLTKLQPEREKDGTREELVLKFFAYLNNHAEFDGRVTHFLNEYMKEATKTLAIANGEKLFKRVADTLFEIIKGPILRKKYHVTPINQAEAILVAVGEILSDGGSVQPPTGDWLNDPELVKWSTKGTNTQVSLRGRIDRAVALLAGPEKQTKKRIKQTSS